ncbi:hypothetical protein ACROYT_G010744 [Oculina patagonica]
MANYTTSSTRNVSGNGAVVRCLYNTVDDEEMKKLIAIIYIVTSVLSILGAGSVIIFAIVKRIVRSPEVHPLFHLALADLLLCSLWFSGACLWFHDKHSNCFILHVFGEIAHLASFLLTVNYGLNAFIRLQEKVHIISQLQLQFSSVSSSRFYIWLSRIFYAMCWLIPVAIMAPLLFHSEDIASSEDCTRCLLLFDRPKAQSGQMKSDSVWGYYGSIALISTLSFSIVALVLVYFLMLRVYRKAVIYSGVLTDLQRASIDAIRNKIFLYILVFLICWSPALVVALCDYDPKISLTNMRHWFALFVVQGLTAPMQGFLNCIVYGWSRKSFRDASEQRRNMLLDSDEYVSSQRRRTSYGSMGSL